MKPFPSLLARKLLPSFCAFFIGLVVTAPVLDTWAADAAPPKPAPKAEIAAIRIRAGASAPHTDEAGVTWLADQGFADGDAMERPGLAIGKTATPSVYWTEHFGMTKFAQKVPNGKYTVRLHFAVTYEAISGAGQCVFSFNVEGKEFKDFDIWEKAGGDRRAHVETVEVTVADGQLDIAFTALFENPTISAIEIIPSA